MPLRECSEGTWIAHVSGSSRFNIGTLSQTTSLPLVILPDMTTDVMCMCHVGGGAATDSPGGGELLWGWFRVRGGYYPEDNSENISRIFVGSVHACTCFSRCAHCVLGVPVRLLRVSRPPALCSVCPLESVRRGLGSLMYRDRVVSISVHCRKRRRYPS